MRALWLQRRIRLSPCFEGVHSSDGVWQVKWSFWLTFEAMHSGGSSGLGIKNMEGSQANSGPANSGAFISVSSPPYLPLSSLSHPFREHRLR